MKNALVIASVAAALASPLAAQSVPLNTVSGGEGQEVATGQAGVALAGSLTGTGLITAITVLTVLAASDGSSSTTE